MHNSFSQHLFITGRIPASVFCLSPDIFVRAFMQLQIRRVDPTLDMEADEGDDYTHLPVCWMKSLSNFIYLLSCHFPDLLCLGFILNFYCYSHAVPESVFVIKNCNDCSSSLIFELAWNSFIIIFKFWLWFFICRIMGSFAMAPRNQMNCSLNITEGLCCKTLTGMLLLFLKAEL